jgi:hypothetical protein
MRSIALLFALVTCLYTADAQERDEMIIHMNDGSAIIYDIDSIESMRGMKLPIETNRVVEFTDRYYEFDHSEILNSKSILFERNNGNVYLRSSGGNRTQITGAQDSPNDSYTESLTFYLLTADFGVYELTSTQEQYPSYYETSWSERGIYAGEGSPLWWFVLDSAKRLISQEGVQGETHAMHHESNLAGDKIAYIRQGRQYYSGSLLELDLNTGMTDTLIVDSMINSVRYDESTGDLIYYTLGHFNSKENTFDSAGYYRFDRATRSSSLLFARAQERDMYNGFDVSSEGNKLLIPYPSRYYPGVPVIVEFDLASGLLDTLDLQLGNSQHSEVWVQYDPTDSLVLYSITYRWPQGASISDVGIFNKSSKETTGIAVAPSNTRPFSAPYPRWSPDGQAICYGGSEIPPNTIDYVGPFLVYVKPLKP